jgi:hypothetical protein
VALLEGDGLLRALRLDDEIDAFLDREGVGQGFTDDILIIDEQELHLLLPPGNHL